MILRRGFSGGNELFDWRKLIVDGRLDRRQVIIRLLDEGRGPVTAWELAGAWPSGWKGPLLNATRSSVAIEELVLTNERIRQI